MGSVKSLFRKRSGAQEQKASQVYCSANVQVNGKLSRAERRRLWRNAWSAYNHDGSGY